MNKISSEAYSGDFFASQVAGSHTAASIILPLLFGDWKPSSIIDIGCGLGPWCAAALDMGIPKCMGVDGAYVQTDWLCIPPDCFTEHNLEEPLPQNFSADVAICVEVAEHLSPERASGFVADLCRIAPLVLFSAAIPYQGGSRHLNENWLEYWAMHFSQNGMAAYDVLRDKIWRDRRVPWWYRQNLMVFAKPDFAKSNLRLSKPAIPSMLTRIHPDMFLLAVHRDKPILDHSFGDDQWLYQQTIAGNMSSANYGKPFDVKL